MFLVLKVRHGCTGSFRQRKWSSFLFTMSIRYEGDSITVEKLVL